MEQVFYREPLKTNIIKFEVKEKGKFVHVFSRGNDMTERKYDGGTIPLYYPECDDIVIDFEMDDKPMVRKREK